MKWSNATPFNEQVGELTRVFSQWNECEQTVVLYALLRRIPAVQARFLAQAVQHSLHSVSELGMKERNANDPEYIGKLIGSDMQQALSKLLLHLPLLNPSNAECKACYLRVIPELVNYCVTTGQFTEQTQQLLSYTLIHPAITSQDRRFLTQWLKDLEDRISSSTVPVTCAVEDYSNTQNSSFHVTRWDHVPWLRNPKQQNDQNFFSGQPSTSTFNPQFPPPINRQRRSNSLTPPVASSHHLEIGDRAGNMNNTSRHKPRSFSVSGDHTSNINIGLSPLSPQSSCASSGSESRLDEAPFRTLASGMRDVPAWLKSLRLHKYSNLFANISYEEMLQTTEEQLAEQGVTKGARHKLALSIAKLHQRYNLLVNLEKNFTQSTVHRDGTQNSFSYGPLLLVNTMDELKTILATPLKPTRENDPQDIPAQFMKVVVKLCGWMVLDSVDDSILCGCVNILEKVMQHDCFSQKQKERVQQWRSRLGNPRPAARWQNSFGYSNNRRHGGNPQQHRKPSLNMSHMHNTHAFSNQFAITSHRNSISTPYLQTNQNQNQNQNMNLNLNNLRTMHVPERRPTMQSMQKVQRIASAPREYHLGQSILGVNERMEPEIDIEMESEMESLCYRVAEQGIGGEA
ncbi:protein Smaug isoform X2 [Ooceraea biroi]|uniref:protein Smaug isoform X2 n=1 Tax=Ooceraea biroi TaxID=2015173 RepID=UPI000F0818BD|nr:protein Smaug isoform X2 [Ooceraea biroi]